jgi:hypothetical protein
LGPFIYMEKLPGTQMYSVFHGSGYNLVKIRSGGLIFDLSQLLLLPQLPENVARNKNGQK